MNKNVKKNALFASPYIIWIAAFIIIPLLFIVYYGFTDRAGNFTLENIKAIARPEYYEALVLSLILAVVSTIICLLLAYPLALILRNMNMSKQGFIVFIFILPMWMNFLLRTLAWQTLIEKTGVINSILTLLNLPTLNIINTYYAIILGMVYIPQYALP